MGGRSARFGSHLSKNREREGKYKPTIWIIEVSPFPCFQAHYVHKISSLELCSSAPTCCFLGPSKAWLLGSAPQFVLQLPTQSCFFSTCLPSACSVPRHSLSMVLFKPPRRAALLASSPSSLTPRSSPQLGAAPRASVHTPGEEGQEVMVQGGMEQSLFPRRKSGIAHPEFALNTLSLEDRRQPGRRFARWGLLEITHKGPATTALSDEEFCSV